MYLKFLYISLSHANYPRDRMNELLNNIDHYNRLGVAEAKDYAYYKQIDITGNSTRIEGSTYSNEEIQTLLERNIKPAGKPINHGLMANDHKVALEFVLAQADKKHEISNDFIKHTAGLVMSSTGGISNTIMGSSDSTKGDYRLGTAIAGKSTFMDFKKVPKAVEELVKRYNRKLSTDKSLSDKIIASFSIHYDLVTIHPFNDGNGRTSRLMMNYVQRFNKLPLAYVPDYAKEEYYDALFQSRDTNTIKPFMDFMTSVYNHQILIDIKSFREGKK